MGLVKENRQTSIELTADVSNSVQQKLWLDSIRGSATITRGLNQAS
ncbi:hypothetical protein [Mycolicibacterium sp. CBMA 234]|nr:hypothetical protein [Mycolicibacterium sp. CBMA 234]